MPKPPAPRTRTISNSSSRVPGAKAAWIGTLSGIAASRAPGLVVGQEESNSDMCLPRILIDGEGVIVAVGALRLSAP